MDRFSSTLRTAGRGAQRIAERSLGVLATAAALLTMALFGVGGLVRGTGSGLGCSSWPKCSAGRWLPPPSDTKGVIEYSHRGLAFLVVVLLVLLLTAILAVPALRARRRLLRAALAAVPLVMAQAALGAVVVATDLNPTLVTVHFATGMALVATVVYLVVEVRTAGWPAGRDGGGDRRFTRLVAAVSAMTFALLLVGTYVRAEHAGLVFRDWPLMNGRLVPALGGASTVMFAHRVLAAGSFLLVVWTAVRARTMSRRSSGLVALSTLAAALFVAQILVGAANVWTALRPWAVTAHVAVSAAIWGTLVALWTVSARLSHAREVRLPEQDATGRAEAGSIRDTIVAYLQLTKPRIIVLLLITTVPAMVLAERGMPSPLLVLATLVGGTIAAGSANAINCYLDRDIDAIMKRTRRRPLPAHRVDPDSALAFGFVLGSISFFLLSITVNVLAASLALSAIAFYVFVYTMWLKRSTTQNIVIGGAAGAVPALVGWAAVTGTVGLPALVLFAIVFVWTPPHFWALAMRYSEDYASAGVPMLPAVRGEDATRRQILLYSLVLLGTSMLLVPFGHMGAIYAAAAVLLGGVFVFRSLQLWRASSPALAMGLFRYSILYLALLFAAVAVDGAWRLPLRA